MGIGLRGILINERDTLQQLCIIRSPCRGRCDRFGRDCHFPAHFGPLHMMSRHSIEQGLECLPDSPRPLTMEGKIRGPGNLLDHSKKMILITSRRPWPSAATMHPSLVCSGKGSSNCKAADNSSTRWFCTAEAMFSGVPQSAMERCTSRSRFVLLTPAWATASQKVCDRQRGLNVRRMLNDVTWRCLRVILPLLAAILLHGLVDKGSHSLRKQMLGCQNRHESCAEQNILRT